MTEKRFRFDTGCIIDMQENKVLTDRQVTNLLNKLHEENKELKQRCDKLQKGIDDLALIFIKESIE